MPQPNEAKEVVNQEDSATSSEAVNEQEVEKTAPESSATQEQNEQSQEVSQATTPVAQINPDLYDERGVPWKNVAMEQRRKYEETQSSLPKLIAEEIAKTTQQQQQKKYSIAELEQFAQSNPEHRAWVEQEKMAILKSELAQEFNQRIEATTKQQKDEAIRAQVFNKVLSTFPEIAIRDQQGNFLGWNTLNPMVQTIGKYMESPDLANRPDGLEVASKLAYADMMMQKMPQAQKKESFLKSQLKKAQSATFIEGNGRKVSDNQSPTKKYLDRVAATGRTDDAAGVFKEIFKAKGIIKE